MTTFSLTLNGLSYSVATSDPAQLAAITACRAKYNDALPQTVKDGDNDVPNPDLMSDDTEYLDYVFGHWAAANPGFDQAALDAAAASAFSSYAGQNPPEQIIESVPLTGDALKNVLKAYAASKRFGIETGGITLNGLPIPTDRETQSKLSGAVLAFQAGALSRAIDWKTSAGWASLNQTSVTALASAVAAHVQKSFSNEKAVSQAIDAGTITTAAEIDAANWS